jgi:hypothetical protein
VEGLELDFRSELRRYFVCECKDWKTKADFSTRAKFCRVLDSVKSRFVILFSARGISGEGKNRDAELEQLKVFQDREIVIVVVDQKDLERVADGANFISLLRRKYERVRLNLIEGSPTRRSPAKPALRRTRARSEEVPSPTFRGLVMLRSRALALGSRHVSTGSSRAVATLAQACPLFLSWLKRGTVF